MAKITIDFGDGRTVELNSSSRDGHYRVNSPRSVRLQEISKELRKAADNIGDASPRRSDDTIVRRPPRSGSVLDDIKVIKGLRTAGLLQPKR